MLHVCNENDFVIGDKQSGQTLALSHFRKVERFMRKWLLKRWVFKKRLPFLGCTQQSSHYHDLPSRMVLGNEMLWTLDPFHA